MKKQENNSRRNFIRKSVSGAIVFGVGLSIPDVFGLPQQSKKINMSDQQNSKPKVTGIGGVFFKSDDPKAMREWYAKNLGVPATDYGATFDWLEKDDPKKEGSTTWSPFKQDTKYFEPSKNDFMINYRVEDIEGLVTELKANGVTIVDAIEDSPYGKFVHILDLEGNKVELWEPK
ncbi:VOC family protein [Mucilaginibacter sp. E4BP6]|uniref:VOC family protein n=1 Tax=Mucilaginibacter sp. E4BP6 TaxID=2723089 RepID=UPI0017E5536F|nr:VOC family protein [Mucilaginibacter sp. E4BP6]NYE67888.1 lactoylglutathione lyase [Mucilaginibacter sp. E4BP6]